MNTLSKAVLDSGVVVKLFVQEIWSQEAITLLRRIRMPQPTTFYAPDLMYIECTNILRKYVAKGDMTRQVAEQNIQDLRHLPFEVTPIKSLITHTFTLTQTRPITAYDACYLALAQRLGIPLITADEKFFRACQPFGDSIFFLGTLTL